MPVDPMTSFWDAFVREPNRWERLREIFEKLRFVLTKPSLAPRDADDLLEQMEHRLDEARRLFPEPDWLSVDHETPQGLEDYCAKHLGGLLVVFSQALDRLAEERAREGDPGVGEKKP